MIREVLLTNDEFQELESSTRVIAEDPDITEVVWVRVLRGDIKYSACYVCRFPFLKTKLRLMTFSEGGFPIVKTKKLEKTVENNQP